MVSSQGGCGMKSVFLVATALCCLSVASHAAQKKPTGWFTFQPAPQTCQQGMTPSEVIAHVREVFRVDPDVDDTTDDNDKVVSTVISWPAANGVQSWEIHTFRTSSACEDYAKSQRADLHKYD